MKSEDLTKTKQELKQELEKNYEQINLCDERTRMSKVTSLEYKTGLTLSFSMIGYLVFFASSSILIKSVGVSTFTNVISALSFPAVLVGGSLGVGTLIRTLMDKKFHVKKRLKSFSTAKTQSEKLEEEIHYQIELEKANNRNLVVEQAINNLDANERVIRNLSSEYDISDKKISKDEGEMKKTIKELSTVVKEQYNKLDVLSTQKILNKRFLSVRSKFQKIWDVVCTVDLSCIASWALINLPLMMLDYSSAISSLLATTLAPFAVGIGGASLYMAKKNKDQKKVFNNLNSQLGENALTEKLGKFGSDYEERNKIDGLIRRQIKDTSFAVIQLKKQERVLENLVSEKQSEACVESKDKTMDYENILSQGLNINHESERYIDENLDNSLPVEEKEGPTLVKRRTNNKR